MRFRKPLALLALAGAALVAVGLTGCDSKVGTAAVVGGHRIADTTVNQYLTPAAVPFSVSGDSGSQRIVPRTYVLTILVQTRLFEGTLAATKGGAPSQADIHSAEDLVKQGSTDAEITKQYTTYGFDKSFATVDLYNTALEQLLAERLKLTNDVSPLLKAIAKTHTKVSVSPRYGVWHASALTIDSSPTAGAPSFVTLHIAPSDAAGAIPVPAK